jgi:hypothetical protein
MPLKKFTKLFAIAAAVVFAPLAFALVVAFLRAERDASEFLVSPAAVPLAEPPKATTTATTKATTTEAIPEQPKEETKSTPTTPKSAEPKAFFQPPAEEKSQPASSKPAPAPVRGAGGDRDCPDFGSQAEAQRFFLENGGPSSDPHRLDRDHDGIACESN